MGVPGDRLGRAEVAIVGLNPGGGDDTYPYGHLWDAEGVNAYFDEKWGSNEQTDSPLQTQVKEWHRLLNLAPEDPLCIQFVPFRSPSWNRLAEPEKSLAFARDLWRWVLKVSPATLFITMGKLPAKHLAALMEAKWIAQLPTGWGKQLIDVYDAPGGKRVIAMPHPSRYRIFGRGGGMSNDVERAFRAAADITDPLQPYRKTP
jgi:uracil-DNA glycosylase